MQLLWRLGMQGLQNAFSGTEIFLVLYSGIQVHCHSSVTNPFEDYILYPALCVLQIDPPDLSIAIFPQNRT